MGYSIRYDTSRLNVGDIIAHALAASSGDVSAMMAVQLRLMSAWLWDNRDQQFVPRDSAFNILSEMSISEYAALCNGLQQDLNEIAHLQALFFPSSLKRGRKEAQ